MAVPSSKAEPGFHGDKRFKDPELIGMGINVEIYKCTDTKTNSTVAIKHFRCNSKDDGFSVVILREISVLKKLDHPNIVRFFDDIYELDGAKLVYECLDCDLEAYSNNVQFIDPDLRKSFLFQILQGVSYIHSKNIIHRNLKPENLLLDLHTKTVKIADFGHTGPHDAPENSSSVTSFNYRAPEQLLNMPEQDSSAVDVWAVGCIFVVLVKGKHPFTGAEFYEVMQKMIWIYGVPKEEDWKGVGEAYAKISENNQSPVRIYPLSLLMRDLEPVGLDLLEKLLCFQPHRRITASDALRHPYFNDLHQDQ